MIDHTWKIEELENRIGELGGKVETLGKASVVYAGLFGRILNALRMGGDLGDKLLEIDKLYRESLEDEKAQ